MAPGRGCGRNVAADRPQHPRRDNGSFTAYNASVPMGARLPAGRYLSLVVDATTFAVTDSCLGEHPPPVAPASLGPVTYLKL